MKLDQTRVLQFSPEINAAFKAFVVTNTIAMIMSSGTFLISVEKKSEEYLLSGGFYLNCLDCNGDCIHYKATSTYAVVSS